MSHRTNNFSALHDTVLLWGARHPHPKLYLEMQENAGAEGEKKEHSQSFNASLVVLPYPGCFTEFSGIGRACSSWGSCCSGSLGSPAH